MLDNPDISNREVARKIGVSENAIRHWKKQSFWEEERQKMIDERAPIIMSSTADNRLEYRKKLEKQRRDLELFFDVLNSNILRTLAIANATCRELLTYDDPLEACSVGTKAGIHILSKSATDMIMCIIKLNQQIYQLDVILEHLENLENDDDD